MARIRTIKPSFFKNEELAELPMTARMLFIGLWCLADKEGRLEDRPKRIKVELFPYDNVEIDQLLSRLQSADFIIRYEVGELKVIQIINFSKHQRITGSEAQSESELPEYQGKNEKETLRKQLGNTLDDRKGKGYIGKDIRKGKEAGTSPDIPLIIFPFDSDLFKEQWKQWKNYKKVELKFGFKSPQSEQAALNDLVKKANGNEETAIAIIHQSMANGWKGLFELKNVINGTSKNGKQATGENVSTQSAFSKIDRMFASTGNTGKES